MQDRNETAAAQPCCVTLPLGAWIECMGAVAWVQQGDVATDLPDGFLATIVPAAQLIAIACQEAAVVEAPPNYNAHVAVTLPRSAWFELMLAATLVKKAAEAGQTFDPPLAEGCAQRLIAAAQVMAEAATDVA